MEPTWIYLSLSTILLSFIFKSLFQTLINKESKKLPPSPLSLPLIGHLHLLKDPIHQSLQDMSHKFGRIFSLRFGSRLVVVISSPSLVEECLSKNDIVFANRPHLLMGKYLGYNFNTIITAPYGQHWRNLRKITSGELVSPHKLNMSIDIRVDEIKRMIFRINELSCNGVEKVELKTMFSELTLNILMRMLVGKRYFGENLENNEEAKRFSGIIKEVFEFSGATFPGDFVPILRLVDYGGYVKRCKSLAKRTDGLLQGLIDERKNQRLRIKDDEETIVGRLICMQESDPEYYTDETIKGLLLVYLLAGTDTSSVTIEWAMSLLLNHPESLEKAKSEIDTQVGQDHLINESQLPALTYLQNIISETHRMFPAAPLLLPHLSSRGCQIGGYEIPTDTILFINACAIQRDPNVWNCPTEFKPERFENLDVDQYKLLPFGVGRRSCPGEALASRMVGLALGSLIQCFDWRRISDENVDLTEGRGLNMPKAQPLVALCKARPILSKIL